ncbi:MAG TPA: polymer-forming cytoskeletal protein [Steroidobacter sp.]|jgi:cytoskeletal protein CcmA (bactofilin family)|nr:polymer-forming cytoskeletal protein [Steroidobacteraceae bacterium]HLS80959.1 polymer-forming cytoskeletal protein [Steroidobacter sp.]
MFSRRKAKPQRIDTLIGAGTRIIGDVHFTGGFHIDGHIKGNVDAPPESGATLSVSDRGVVEGSVAAPNVMLNGVVKGDILAHERVELGSTARVTGNVYYALIEMEMGAEINGKLIHETPQSRAPCAEAATDSPDAAPPQGEILGER